VHERHLLEWFSSSNAQLSAWMTVVASKGCSGSLLESPTLHMRREDELKQVNRGRGRPPKAPAFLQGLPDEIPREATVTDEPKK